MFVRWQTRARWTRDTWRNPSEEGDPLLTAVLVESVREGASVRQKHIAYLGGLRSWAVADPEGLQARGRFWDGLSTRLDRLALEPAERHRIEKAIAAKVARPTAAQRRQADREEARAGKAAAAAILGIVKGQR